jgi:hypothetical protein
VQSLWKIYSVKARHLRGSCPRPPDYDPPCPCVRPPTIISHLCGPYPTAPRRWGT